MCDKRKKLKRVTLKLKQPNPLFEKWLGEWKEEAAARGSDMQYCFGKALKSLQKYPLPLNSGRECGILQNFGNRLCVMLDCKLAEYMKQNPKDISSGSSFSNLVTSSRKQIVKESVVCDQLNSNLDNVGDLVNESQRNKAAGKAPKQKKTQNSSNGKVRRRNTEDYAPACRSGSYAILLGLLSCSQQEGYPGYVIKADLIKIAQPLCDSSFSKPEHGSFYTAWSSMASLLKKGLVSSAGRGKYALTDTGELLALRLKNVSDKQEEPKTAGANEFNDLEIIDSSAAPTCSKLTDDEESRLTISEVNQRKQNKPEKRKLETGATSVVFVPGSFEVILLIDTHEVSGTSGTVRSNEYPFNDLHKMNIITEVRHLKVGDFVWICRDKISGNELVLPYIVERKRVDDFAKSILDGRYREQKFRLRRCGIPNLIYLVEKHGKESHTVLPVSTLNQAAINTEIIDEFVVKYTNNHKESASYLGYLTQFLSNLFMSKTIFMCNKNDVPPFSVKDDIVSLMSFAEFNGSAAKIKKLCVREMFIKQLIQLNGLSVDMAKAIVERYPTPKVLHSALNSNPNKELIADITYGYSRKRVSAVVSKVITELYTSTVLK